MRTGPNNFTIGNFIIRSDSITFSNNFNHFQIAIPFSIHHFVELEVLLAH